ncbi:bacteriohemerythrin [Rhodoferax sp.]|uniref:bacteriohemerythrin n=1 Tax=Rhodoferax sp. TaxID=50421 RepID=UPI00274AF984|nr:bacteriohemerythrin [Rhodoferax sp.]
MKDDQFGAYEERRWRPIVWTPSLEVGVDVIDNGHRALIELYNSIREASQLKDRAWTGVLLERLGNATAAHFEDEEKLMSGINYAHAADHKDEHRKLLDEFAHQVDEWRDRHNSAELLCRFLYAWLVRHVAALDARLAQAIKEASGANGEA